MDNSFHGILSPSNVAAIQLAYGIRGKPFEQAGQFHAQAGFEVDGRLLVGSVGIITPQWRNDGLLDAMFSSAVWDRDGVLLADGAPLANRLELPVPSLSANTIALISMKFVDIFGRTQLATQNVERSDSKLAAMVVATVLRSLCSWALA